MRWLGSLSRISLVLHARRLCKSSCIHRNAIAHAWAEGVLLSRYRRLWLGPVDYACDDSMAVGSAISSFPAETMPLWPSPTALPVVFYVHNRPEYFIQAVDAVAAADGADDIVVIVSHDGLTKEMDGVVRHLASKLPHGAAQIRQIVHSKCGPHSRLTRADATNAVLKVKDHWWWLMGKLW
eukprot:SAG31_NODE_1034_length_10228_cov_89.107316_10_plen_181_part_00